MTKLDRLWLVGQCYKGPEAYQFLEQHSEDVVFLDIDLPALSGLELLRSLPIRPPSYSDQTTAYGGYGPKSYEVNVVDTC